METALRILLTSPTYPPFNSGLGNAVREQAAALAARGCRVTVATGGPERLTREDPQTGAHVEEFAVSGADWIARPLRGDLEGYRAFLSHGQYDAVVLNAWQTWSTDIALSMLDRITGRKYLYSHGLSTDIFFPFQPVRSTLRWLAWRPYRLRLTARMRALDGLIFLAENGCDCRFNDLVLAQRLGLPLRIIPNAIPRHSAGRLASQPVPRPRRTTLIAVGAYESLKGHDCVLRAYAASKAKNRIPLRISGQNFTPFTETLRHLAVESGIDPTYVTFHEGRSENALLDWYDEAIALISGSHMECQPLVLLDAMVTGTPFIARARGCIPWLAGGWTVGSEKQMAGMINTLINDEAAWNTLSEAGFTEARAHHGPTIVGEALSALLLGR